MNNILTIAKNFQIEYLKDTIIELENFQEIDNFQQIKFTITDILIYENLNYLTNNIPSTGKFIYFFNTNQSDLVFGHFLNYKNKENIKLTRKNNFDKSENLYVGSSNNLHKRFKEHCGYASKSTYAIKFKEWLTDDKIEIKFNYIKLNTENQLILQNIENGLWKTMKPIFGKYGSKY
jgi:hypothetical protein